MFLGFVGEATAATKPSTRRLIGVGAGVVLAVGLIVGGFWRTPWLVVPGFLGCVVAVSGVLWRYSRGMAALGGVVSAALITFTASLPFGGIGQVLNLEWWQSGNVKSVLPANAFDTAPPTPESPSPASTTSPQAADEIRKDLAGRWRIGIRIDHTTYSPFLGLTAEYDVTFSQSGNTFAARGVKVAENGLRIPERSRDTIAIDGHLTNSRVTATYILHGSRRDSTGGFEWVLSRDSDRLDGTFFGDRSETRGASWAARRP